ncbi:metallophosphoesterase family protein [Archangium violaceum]|uniref:metallophosphoesterase n=1 Tax=Archangium violaceum TaxID=83451 RepID=UPI00194F139F|nr:metallophosphoesterase [Archangium violaceum]QRN96768.1 metallophosphoesterase family protein [Archangium violaceum]
MNEAFKAQEQRFVLLAFLIAIVCSGGLFLGVKLLLAKLRKRPVSRGTRRAAVLFIGLLLIGVGCFVYALTIEADWLQVTRVEVRTPRLPAGNTLRIVHLSDLHVDGWTRALSRLPDEVNALQPDLLVFTGDSLNSEAGLPVLREVLSRIQTRYGRFAVQGNHDVSLWRGLDLFGGGVAEELRSEALRTAEGRLVLCGAPYGAPGAVASCLRDNTEGFRLVAYHTPDLVEDLAPLGPDLYLAGHTHGGQVRLPFYGAVLTMSRFDKKYEMGRYEVGQTTLFVSRGVGVEPHAPRIRFLCRPEIAVIDLVGTGGP